MGGTGVLGILPHGRLGPAAIRRWQLRLQFRPRTMFIALYPEPRTLNPNHLSSYVEGPMPARFYILRLRTGALYPGVTTDLHRRYAEHRSDRACRTTRLDPPLALAYAEELPAFSDARLREAQVKRWSWAKKGALVAGDMTSLHRLAASREHR